MHIVSRLVGGYHKTEGEYPKDKKYKEIPAEWFRSRDVFQAIFGEVYLRVDASLFKGHGPVFFSTRKNDKYAFKLGKPIALGDTWLATSSEMPDAYPHRPFIRVSGPKMKDVVIHHPRHGRLLRALEHWTFEVPNQYQHLRQPKIIRPILLKQYPFLKNFNFTVYGFSYAVGNLDRELFYIEGPVKGMELYVPYTALVVGDIDAIKQKNLWQSKTWPQTAGHKKWKEKYAALMAYHQPFFRAMAAHF